MFAKDTCVPRARARRLIRDVVVAAACALLTARLALAAEPARLESYDPLSRPAPSLKLRLVLPEDNQRPEEKIVPRLWQRLNDGEDGSVIPVIIELYSPQHRTKATRHSEAWDSEQAELAAAAEHQFSNRAAGLVAGMRGIPGFPVVSGRVHRDNVETVAALSEVKRMYLDEVQAWSRTQGVALIRADALRTGPLGTGQGIGVAIVDSGVDATHPEFSGAIVAQGNYTNEPGPGTIDLVGHGTACAGIVGGRSGGVAPASQLWAIRAGSSEGVVTSDALAALASLYSNRTQFGGLHVINLSFGGLVPNNADCDASSPYDTIFDALSSAGVAIFVSSGNDGFLNGVSSPACHSKVVAVGAVFDANIGPAVFSDCTDGTTAADKIACYSNSGTPLDILAPGHCATTPKPGSSYEACFGGTSASAPYAAGVAAQLLQLHPGTTPAQLRTALMTTGKPITDVNGITRNRIDAVSAHQALGGGGATGPCVQDATTACVLNGRFRATVRYRGAFDNNPADTNALRKPVTGFANPNFETVFFYFNSLDNIEILLKMLDQGNTNGQGQPTIAVLFGSATPLRVELTITDTLNGATKTYTSQFNSGQGATDFTAFVR